MSSAKACASSVGSRPRGVAPGACLPHGHAASYQGDSAACRSTECQLGKCAVTVLTSHGYVVSLYIFYGELNKFSRQEP